MTTNYTITAGTHPNSIEVYFDSKPALDVINALKGLKFRWNHKKACWYGFENEHTVVDTLIAHGMGENIDGEEVEGATVYTDGYLGGGAVYGSKSNRHLYGAELSKAIRDDIKAAGIKGVSVRCKKFSGGQEIFATITLTPNQFTSLDSYIDSYEIPSNEYWITLTDGSSIHRDVYYAASSEQREEYRTSAARYTHNLYTCHEHAFYNRFPDRCAEYTPATLETLKKIDSIIAAYHYDESNGMVDYFNTNFYYTISTKPATV